LWQWQQWSVPPLLLSPPVAASVLVTASDEAHKVSALMALPPGEKAIVTVARHNAVTAAVAEKLAAVAMNEASDLRRIQS